MDAASLLRNARLRADLSQRKLAHLARVPQSTVARIELGTVDPRSDTLDRLLAAAGQELDSGRRPGIGVDRTQIRELLRLSPRERLELAAGDAAGLRALDERTQRR